MTKIHYAVEDQIAVITLDDGKMNVMNWDFFKEFNEALDRALADRVNVLIFT
jgi:enoyl-CoA hydratase/carnithine racemase